MFEANKYSALDSLNNATKQTNCSDQDKEGVLPAMTLLVSTRYGH